MVFTADYHIPKLIGLWINFLAAGTAIFMEMMAL
jgi:hypothetical protein